MQLFKKRIVRAALCGAILAASTGASAAITSLNLSNYTLAGSYGLPNGTAAEASAVTYNWDTGTLFVLGDEGDYLVEVSKTGAQLSAMALSNFNDTEGVTYIGGGQFVIGEERLRDAYRLTYSAGGTANRTGLSWADLGTTVGNIGIEGISFDPRDGSFITVKEKDPQGVQHNTLTFGSPGTATINALFTPNLGVIDLADVQVLATVSSLMGSGDENNLLVLSQETPRLMEVTRNGVIVGSFDLSGLTANAEGVTIDADGNIYIVAEESFGIPGSTLLVLAPSPVPVPAALPLMGSALGGLALWGRRRRARAQ